MTFFQKIFNRSPLLYGVLPLIIGILLADAVGHPCVVIIASILIFLISFLVVQLHHRHFPSVTIWCIFLLFSCLGAGGYALHHFQSNTPWPLTKRMWRAIIIDASDRGKIERCTLQLVSEGNDTNWRGCRNFVNAVFLKDSNKVVDLRSSDAVLFYGRINNLRNEGNPCEFDEAGWLKRRGITGDIFVARDWRKLSQVSAKKLLKELPLWDRIRIGSLRLREQMTAHYDAFPLRVQDRGVLAALTLGDKYRLSHEVRDVYSHVGVSHILALSGLHLGILMFFLLLVLKPLCRYHYGRIVSMLLALTLIWFFAFLTGMGLSLLRAAVMYSLFCLLMLRRQGGNGLNNLAVAAFVLLCVEPDALFDIGFQLSFLSVFSILIFSPYYNRFRPQPRLLGLLADFVFVAVAAQLVTSPLVAYYFNTFPVYFLLGNVVVIPCAYVLLGGTLAFFLFSFCAPIQLLLVRIISFTVTMMNESLSFIASLPHSVISIYPSSMEVVIAYMLLLSLILYVSCRQACYLAAFAILCMMGICVEVYRERPGRVPSQIVFYNVWHNPTVHFIESASQSWLWCRYPETATHDLTYISRRFWRQKHMAQPMVFNGNASWSLLKCRDNVIRFCGYTLVMLQDGRWRNRITKNSLAVDFCYICRGYYGSLLQLRNLFHPHMVVLDISLSNVQRQKFLFECHQLRWPCYDIASSGAYIKKCS